jgi:hypothetical protein
VRRPALAQGRVVAETAHRPWRLPSDSWRMALTWGDLLFALDSPRRCAARPRARPLTIDRSDGNAWLAVS